VTNDSIDLFVHSFDEGQYQGLCGVFIVLYPTTRLEGVKGRGWTARKKMQKILDVKLWLPLRITPRREGVKLRGRGGGEGKTPCILLDFSTKERFSG